MAHKDKQADDSNLFPATASLIEEISTISARAYLNNHTPPEATITDTRELMEKNTKLGRMILETAGGLAARGISPQDAYLLGVIHGLGLAERRRQEEAFTAQLEIGPSSGNSPVSSKPQTEL